MLLLDPGATTPLLARPVPEGGDTNAMLPAPVTVPEFIQKAPVSDSVVPPVSVMPAVLVTAGIPAPALAIVRGALQAMLPVLLTKRDSVPGVFTVMMPALVMPYAADGAYGLARTSREPEAPGVNTTLPDVLLITVFAVRSEP